MKINSLVSVVLPVFNGEQFVLQAINSVLCQSYKNLELIIIDDHSTDNTISVCKGIQDPRIRIFSFSENSGGPAKGRNLGVQSSIGEFIAFIDADDIWAPEKLSIQLEIIAKQDCYMISSKKIIIDDNVKNEDIFNKEMRITTSGVSYQDLLRLNYIPNSSVLIKKAIINKFTFEENKMYIGVEDHKMWLDIHNIHGPSRQVNIGLIGYRVYGRSLSSNKLKMLIKRYYVLKSHKCSRISILILMLNFFYLFLNRKLSN